MLIQVDAVRRNFTRDSQTIEVLKGISFSVKAGEFVSVMGPSGSGKSTLLQILGGLDRATGGDVRIGGESLARMDENTLSLFRRRKLGFIFQFFNLMPMLSAIENVALPLLLDGQPLSKVRPRAMDLLNSLGVAHRADNRPHQLSGGEMQRVAICRALITQPPLILADEPTGNLDSKTGAQVLETLRSIVKDRGQTLMMVTHDPKAAEYGTRLVKIRDGQIESDTAVGAAGRA